MATTRLLGSNLQIQSVFLDYFFSDGTDKKNKNKTPLNYRNSGASFVPLLVKSGETLYFLGAVLPVALAYFKYVVYYITHVFDFIEYSEGGGGVKL